jgi:hypothetical protein
MTALSARELINLLDLARALGNSVAVIVARPFEFLKKRDFRYTVMRPLVQARLRRLCVFLAANKNHSRCCLSRWPAKRLTRLGNERAHRKMDALDSSAVNVVHRSLKIRAMRSGPPPIPKLGNTCRQSGVMGATSVDYGSVRSIEQRSNDGYRGSEPPQLDASRLFQWVQHTFEIHH